MRRGSSPPPTTTRRCPVSPTPCPPPPAPPPPSSTPDPPRGGSRARAELDWVSWPGYVRRNHRPPAQARRGGEPGRDHLRPPAWIPPVRERPRHGQRRRGLLRRAAGRGPVLLAARASPGDRAPGGGTAGARHRDR